MSGRSGQARKQILAIIVVTVTFLACFALILNAKEEALIDGWSLIAPLPEGLASPRAMVYGDTIYVVGGKSQQRRQSPVVAARVEAGGTIQTWQPVSVTGTLPVSIYLHSLVTAGNNFYIIGAGMRQTGMPIYGERTLQGPHGPN